MRDKVFEICKAEFSNSGRSGTEQIFNRGTRDNVTPAEYKLLEEIHGRRNVVVVEFNPDHIARETDGFKAPAQKKGSKKHSNATAVPVYRPRTNDEEVHRLRRWYGVKIFNAVFPDKYPELPTSFKHSGIHTSKPDNVSDITEGLSRAEQTKKLLAALSPKERDDLLDEYGSSADPSQVSDQGAKT